ncbi:MAG: hypothetical protein PQJ60_09030 [Spirochaetales bacterium]|nr:hypothetical protein [Spirochaetales bacterium]
MNKTVAFMAVTAALAGGSLLALEDGGMTWDGEFTYEVGTDLISTSDGVSQDMDVELSAHVGELTSFSVEIEADPDESAAWTWSDDNEDDVVDTEETYFDFGYLVLDSIELIQDFSPWIERDLTLVLTAGYFEFQGTYYDNVYEWEWDESASNRALRFDGGFAGFTLSAYLPLSEIADDLDSFAFEALYEADWAHMAVHILRDGDEEWGVAGGAFQIMPAQGMALYGQYLYDIDVKSHAFMSGVAYELGSLTIGTDILAVIGEGVSFGDYALVATGVSYVVTERLLFSSGVYLPLESTETSYAFDSGMAFDVDRVTYTAGFSYAADEADPDLVETYVAPQSAADYEGNLAFSFSMDIDF